jgi:polyphosphate kinase 2 (PPK2 family)
MLILSIPAQYMQSPFIGQMFEESPVYEECIVKTAECIVKYWMSAREEYANSYCI